MPRALLLPLALALITPAVGGSGAASPGRSTPCAQRFSRIQGPEFPYDDNGNLTDDGTRVLVWDAFNRLVGVARKTDGAPVAAYFYLPDGRRSRKVVYSQSNPGVVASEVRSVWDGAQEVEEQSAAGVTLATFVWSPVYVDELVEFRREAAHPLGAGSFYAHQDARCDVVAVTDGAGQVVERRRFDDFGREEIRDSAGAVVAASPSGLEYGYQGRRRDSETGWVYFRARFYDPGVGRFLSRDPVWDAANVGGWYSFVGNGPVSGRDPFGDQGDAAQEQDAAEEDGYLTRFANWVGGKAEPVVLAPFRFVAWVAGGAKSGGEAVLEVAGDAVTDTAVKTMEAAQAADNLVGAAAPLEGSAYGVSPADPQQNNRYYEAQLQQRGRMFAKGGVVNENVVELGDKGGRAGFQAGSGGVMFGTSLRKLGKYDIERYGSFNVTSRSGDPWEGHELLQNAWLKVRGLSEARGKGAASRDNPALAVDKDLHKLLNRLQKEAGLHNPAVLGKQTALENIAANAEVLRKAGVPEEVITKLVEAATMHAKALPCE